jgi:hypothetical protein
MGQIIIYVSSRKGEKSNLTTTHLWYDYATQKMQSFIGGKLAFSYVGGKTIARTEPVTRNTASNNKMEITQWLDTNKDLYTEANCNGTQFIVDFPDSNLDDIISSLNTKNFHYEII